MDLWTLQRNIQGINAWEILKPTLQKHEKEFVDANREQLISGETNKGEMIHPKYTEDPYFKSRGQALGYAKWKHKLEESGQIPKPKSGTKYFTAPNMYIKGNLHSNMRMTVSKEGLIFDAQGFGQGFDSKWKDIFGVTRKNLDIIIDEDIRSEFRDNLLKHISK
jgi:hypothetical protein